MAEHNLSYSRTYREDNDSPDDISYEGELARIVRECWIKENCFGLRPNVYVPGQVKTNQMAEGPYILIYPPSEDGEFIGIGAPATREDMNIKVDIRVLHRGHMLKVRQEFMRIVKAHRKAPFMNVDQLMRFSGRPVEPTAGNYMYSYDLQYKVYVNPVIDE